MRITDTHIYFWGSFLSNWIPNDLKINYDNNIFSNSEQLFMYMKAKFFNDSEKAKEIVQNGSEPRIAKKLGREVKNYDDEKWSQVREKFMYEAVYLKFFYSQELRKLLLDTDSKILVEGTPKDIIWGVGVHWEDDKILDEKNWKGLNLLGKVLMRVREELK